MSENDKTCPPDPDAMLPEILALETQVWSALVAGDQAADRALLTEDFLGVYGSGFANRDDHAGAMAAGPTMAGFDLDQAQLRLPGPGLALLSYRARYRRIGRAETEVMYITSLWEKRAGGWVNSFSQDTPAL